MNKSLIKPIKSEISKKKKKGFTLVELIIVIAVIAILAAIAIPKFGQVRQDAKVSNDIATAKNIQSTTSMLIGNGTIKETTKTITLGDEATDTDKDGKKILDRLDGKKVPTAKEGMFQVKITATGDVSVISNQATDVVLAPADEKTAENYTAAINKEQSSTPKPKP